MNKKNTVLSLCIFIIIFLFTQQVFSQVTFSAKTDFSFTVAAYASYADLNGDGLEDMVVVNFTNDRLYVCFNTTSPGASTPSFSAPVTVITPDGPTQVYIADINGDGKKDLSVSCYNAHFVSFYLNTTTPGSSTPSFSAVTNVNVGVAVYGLSSADINSDGKPDIVGGGDAGNNILVLINTTATGASTPSFSLTTIATSTTTRYVTTADFNGDGLPDIAAGNVAANNFSVFLNTTAPGAATPTFGAKTDFSTAIQPQTIKSADINKDGKPDVVTVNQSSGVVSVFFNTAATGSSTPTFTVKTDFTVGTNPVGISLEDLNNDGLPDMTVTNASNSNISVFLNTTAPGASIPVFTTAQHFAAGDFAFSVAAVDFNGDGKRDLAVQNYGANTVSVLMNTTDLSNIAPLFSAKTDFTTETFPYSVSTADFNGDGKQDVVTANASHGNVSVLMNTTSPGASTPTFTSKVDFPTAINIQSATTGDINNDGKPDIISANGSFSPGIISVLLNVTPPGSTTPLFSANTDFAVGNVAIWVSIGDLNGDGISDIATANLNGNSISVLFNTTTPGSSTPTFTPSVNLPNGLSPYSVQIRDINGDGMQDLISANYDGNSVSVYINTTTPGSLTPSFLAKTDFTTGTHPTCARVRDINGDGKPDLITLNYSANSQSILLNTTTPGAATPTFTAKTDFPSNGNPYSVELGDLNGDGKPDMAVTNYTSTIASVYLNTTTPGASTPTFTARTDFTVGNQPFSVAFADINLDGKPDLITASEGASGVSVLLNTVVYALPVELSSFTSSVNGNNVMLNWNTVSEENNSGFDIERNSFGTGWNKIGFAAGKGTTNVQQNYSFTDNGLNSGRYSYRLKQIDYNGNYKYYDLQNEVVIGVPGKFALMQNYPNPFNPSTIINYQLAINSFVTLKIYDISGREVKQLVNEIQQAGYYAVDFNAAELSSGTYFYKLTSDKFSDVKKMLVIK